MDTQDLEYIRGFQDVFEHGVKMETTYTCPKCGGTGAMPVPFRYELLLSFGEILKRRVGDAIRAHVLSPHVSK
jgi:predicted methyltransferase